MSEEMKGTTRYLDATVMEYALLDTPGCAPRTARRTTSARVRGRRRKAAPARPRAGIGPTWRPDRNIVDRVGARPHVPRRRDGGLRGA